MFYFLVIWFATLSVPQYIMLIRLPNSTHNYIRFFLNAEGSFKCFYFMFIRVSKLTLKITYVLFYLVQVMLAYSCHYHICPVDTVKTVYSRIAYFKWKNTFSGRIKLVLYICQMQRNFPHLKTFLWRLLWTNRLIFVHFNLSFLHSNRNTSKYNFSTFISKL